jgi:hypothetical protein
MIRTSTFIKSYAYFRGELERNEKLTNYYKDEIQKLLTRYYSQ